MNDFRVRIYVNGSSPIVVSGGRDPLGMYVLLRPATEGRAELRLAVRPGQLRPLVNDSEADYEFVGAIPAERLQA